MRKRRKVLVILGLIALAAACFVTLRPRDEPKYQGRHLSEWMERYDHQIETAEAERAVLAIGTNALPHFLKWMRYERRAWQTNISQKLPRWITENRTVVNWLGYTAWRRASHGFLGIRLMGTNAVSVIPELTTMMKDHTRPRIGISAYSLLIGLGEPALPVFRSVLADTNQADRADAVWAIGVIAELGNTNACVPIVFEALNDPLESVREAASNTIQRLAPLLLTNAPANRNLALPR